MTEMRNEMTEEEKIIKDKILYGMGYSFLENGKNKHIPYAEAMKILEKLKEPSKYGEWEALEIY